MQQGKAIRRQHMKPHLDIEYRGYRDTLLYTLLDEATQETFTVLGSNLKILTASYFTHRFEMH